MADQVIAYVTLDQAQTIVATSGMLDRGAWSPSLSYAARDAVLYNDAYYFSLQANFNKPPTTSPSDWLILCYVTSGTSGHTTEEAYQLALQAFEIAVSGTNGIDAAVELAGTALVTAWAGTAAAITATAVASNALSVANQAFNIAVNGTDAIGEASDLAYRALQTAWSGTQGANSAMSVAVAGTQAAAAAEAHALVALQTAWLGTVSYGSNGWNGTITFDLATTKTYEQRPIAADTHIIVLNPQAVRGLTAVLVSSSGTDAPLTFNPSDMSWFGNGMPTAIAAGKRMIINFTSFGSSGSEIHAAYTQQV